MHKTIYISGPMTGKPDNNRVAFDQAKRYLKARYPGAYVISPPDLDYEREGWTWVKCMKDDLKYVVDADVIVTLEGWRQSRGARLEVLVAQELGIPVLRYPSMRRVTLD